MIGTSGRAHFFTLTVLSRSVHLQEETGLEKEQIVVLRRAFESFDKDKQGFITTDTVGDILRMMGIKVSTSSLKSIVEEIDEDGTLRALIKRDRRACVK